VIQPITETDAAKILGVKAQDLPLALLGAEAACIPGGYDQAVVLARAAFRRARAANLAKNK
jgi:hypothetical protein